MLTGADQSNITDRSQLETLFFRSSLELCRRLQRITANDEAARHILIDVFRRIWKYRNTTYRNISIEQQLEEACIKQAALTLRLSNEKESGALTESALLSEFRQPLPDSHNSGPQDLCDTHALWQELLEAIEDDEFRASKYLAARSKRPMNGYFRLAGLIVILLCLVYLYYQHGEKTRPTPQQILSAHTEDGERTDLLFPDNTRIWLNQKSSLLYPAEFERQPLVLYITGEAYFEVIKRAEKPVIIEAGIFSFQSYGGSFSINSGEEDPDVLISVFSGQVQWKEKDSRNYHYVIDEEQTLSLCSADGSSKIIPLNRDPNLLAWKTGLVTFTDTDIPTVLKTLEKSHMVRFVGEKISWASYRFTGKFQDARIEDILSEISLKIPISFILEDGAYRLSVSEGPNIIDDYPQVDVSH